MKKRVAVALVVALSAVVCAGWLLPASPEVEARRVIAAELPVLHALFETPSEWARFFVSGEGVEVRGPASGVDAAVHWSGGTVVVTASVPARGVWLDWQLANGFDAKQAILLERQGASTAVRWIHREHVGWNPALRYLAWLRSRRVERDLEERLNRIAARLEEPAARR